MTTKKQFVISGIVAAILTGVFMYLCYYFPHELVEVLFWIVSTAFCFGCFYLVIALILAENKGSLMK